jgi:hypothetical protein
VPYTRPPKIDVIGLSVVGEERLAKKKAKIGVNHDPLRETFRSLHARGNIKLALPRIRSTIAPSLIPSFIKRLHETPIYRSLLTRSLFPRDILMLAPKLPAHEPSLNRDLLWTAVMCRKYSIEINRFITLRDNFDNLFINGKYSEASNCLEEIRKTFGYSLWYLDNKFQILQLSDGLSTQKAFLSEIVETPGINGFLAYLCYFFSLRAEAHVSSDYLEGISEGITTAGISAKGAAFINYIANPLSLIDQTSPHYCVNSSEYSSLVDRYLILVRVMQLLYSRGKSDERIEVTTALQQLLPIEDRRLSVLRQVCSEHSSHFVPNAEGAEALSAFDAFTRGDYAEAHDIAKEVMQTDGGGAALSELMVRATLFGEVRNLPADTRSLASQVTEAIKNVLTMSVDFETSIVHLEKIALVTAHMPFALELLAFTKRRHSFEPGVKYSHLDRFWAIASSTLVPQHHNLLDHYYENTRLYIRKAGETSISFKVSRAVFAKLDENTQQEIELLAIPESQKRYHQGLRALISNDLIEARSFFKVNATSSNEFTAAIANECLFKTLLRAGDFEACLVLACKVFHGNANSVIHYDLALLISLVQSEASHLIQKIRFANVVSFAFLLLDNHFETLLSDVFESVLESYDIDRPSMLFELLDVTDRDDIVHFMTHVATIRIMEDSTKFSDLDEIETERIAICNRLSEIDPDNKPTYSAENRQIIRSRQMGELREQISESKMYVDEAGVRHSLLSQIEDSYKRYKELLNYPELNYQAELITKRLGKLLEQRDSTEGDKAAADMKRLRLPSTERQGVLTEIYRTLLERFLFSPEYGLDSHISTNVRHGTFVGHARRCLAERRLVTARNTRTSRYEKNNHWYERYPSLDSEITSALNRFSDRVDTFFNHTNDELFHVRSSRKPEGMFNYSDSDGSMDEIAMSISRSTTLEEFTSALFDGAWRQTQLSMSNIRSYVGEKFTAETNRYFDLLITELDECVPRDKIPELSDAISHARTEFNASAMDISHWFHPPSRVDDQPYSFDIIVDVAEKEILSCYGGHNICLNKTNAVLQLVSGRKVFGFIEILFILIQNAIIHGAQGEPIDLDIKMNDDGSLLTLVVSNKLGPTIDLDERRKNACEAIARYSGMYAVERMRIEGGSGLSKVWRTAEYNLKSGHTARMEVTDERYFVTFIEFETSALFV